MKQRVEFELQSDLMCGGVRILYRFDRFFLRIHNL